jgi:nucleoside-diphosphate-sugar epimerase
MANLSIERPRIVVTGALCYLGQHLWRRLLNDNWHPIALVRTGSEQRAQAFGIPVEDLYSLPVNPRDWVNFLTDLASDAAIHLAAVNTNGTFVQEDMLAIQLTNVYLPVCLSQALARTLEKSTNRLAPLIIAGSHWQTVDGRPNCPLNYYAASKQAAEELLRPAEIRQAGVRVVALRLGDVYGPRDPRKKFLNLVMTFLSQDKQLPASPGFQGLDLVHVDDVANAFMQALDVAQNITDELATFGVSSGRHLTLRDLVAQIDTLAMRSCRINWGARPYRPHEVFMPNPGPSLPGWQPAIDLVDGLKQILEDEGLLQLS